MIFPDEFRNFTWMSFDINPIKLLKQSLVPGRVTSGLWKPVVKFFLECRVKFLGYKRLIFIRFYWLLITTQKLDVAYLKFPQNESKKLIKLWKLKVCPGKMCRICMHINFFHKPCFKDSGTNHCIKAEFFHTTLIITIGLLIKVLEQISRYLRIFKGALKRFLREISAFV